MLKTHRGLLVALLLALPATARAAADGTSNTFLVGEKLPERLAVELAEPWEALWEELEARGGAGHRVIWIKVRSRAAFPELVAAIERGERLSWAWLVREEGGRRSTIEVRSFQIISAGEDPRFGPQTLRLEGTFRLVAGAPGATDSIGDVEFGLGVGQPVRAKVMTGDLLARIESGRAGGQGRVLLEGDQALVFFLGGIPARTEPIPEIRGRTADGKEFVLRGVRVESLTSAGATARGRLLYQDLVIPP